MSKVTVKKLKPGDREEKPRVLKANILQQILGMRHLEQLLCPRCGQPILPGDPVHRTSARFKYYHQGCWDSMLIS